MLFYLTLLVIIYVLNLIIKPEKNKSCKRKFIIVVFIVLIAISGLRSPEVGADTAQYCRYYSIIGMLNWNDVFSLRYEPGFILFCKLLYFINTDYQFLLIVSSIFILVPVGLLIYRYSKSPALSVTFFICLQNYAMSMSIMRQSIALGIVLLAIPLLLSKKKLPYALMVVIAAQFHISAWVMLVPLLVIYLKRNKISVRYYILASAICVLIAGALLNFGISLFGETYTSYATSLSGNDGQQASILYFVFYLFLIFLAVASGHRNVESNEDSLFLRLSAFTLPVCALTFVSNAYTRFQYLFSIFLIISIPNFLHESKKSKEGLLMHYLVLLSVIVVYVVVSVLRPEWFEVIPYEFCFNF